MRQVFVDGVRGEAEFADDAEQSQSSGLSRPDIVHMCRERRNSRAGSAGHPSVISLRRAFGSPHQYVAPCDGRALVVIRGDRS